MDSNERIIFLMRRLESGDITDLEYRELQALLSIPESELNDLIIRFEQSASRELLRLKAKRKKAQRRMRPVYLWIGSAAAVITILIAAFQFFPRTKIYETGIGEVKEIALPDGSQVTLNENSHLSYRSNPFGKSIRQIQFSGEGFFQVWKDSSAAFTIESPSGTTTVLGTSFYLSDYPESGHGRIDLVEGKVSFTSTNNDTAILLPGEALSMNAILHKEKTVNTNYRYWKTRHLTFDNEKLEIVIAQLEQILNLDIDIGGEASGCTLDSEFNDETPQEILSVIAIAFGGSVERSAERVFVLHDLHCF